MFYYTLISKKMKTIRLIWWNIVVVLGLLLSSWGSVFAQPGACDLLIPLSDDLKAKPELEDFFKNNPSNGIKSYEVLFDYPTLRKDKDALQAVNDFLDDTGVTPTSLKDAFDLAKDQTQFLDELGASLSQPNVNPVWKETPTSRGNQIEASLINGFNDGWPNNFPVIDGYDAATGTAISIKSIDLNAKTYQNLAALENRLMDYFRKLRDFTREQRGLIDIGDPLRTPINFKELVLAVPRQPTAAEQAIINKVINSAMGLTPPISIRVTVF
ncbi:hypothetical protein Halhy_5056 [Haliscomenobacter hydrossis DSM 1100]|uniref:CdiA toxin EC869-like domain-containing protein n=2 Tax=Haliscomenobacter TaxID=2349 RepID=F4L2C9_HALH1|nr:hypothetical protein Halhy_5056 [Haliscomenobacter hydrossis DSM 1100]